MTFSGTGRRRRRSSRRRTRGGSAPAPESRWSRLAKGLLPVAKCVGKHYLGLGRRRRTRRSRAGGRRRVRGGDFWSTIGNIGQSLLPLALPIAQTYLTRKAAGGGRRRRSSRSGGSYATKLRNLAKARAAKRRYAGVGRRRSSRRGHGLFLPGQTGHGLFM